MAKLDIFPLLEQQGKTKYWLYKQLGMSYQTYQELDYMLGNPACQQKV